MALVGFRYIQDTDPGAVGFGYEWALPSTAELFVRNQSNTAWVLIGNINSDNMGMLPIAGGTVTGAVAGASGLAPQNSPDFQTAAKRDGVNLARMTDLTTWANALRAEFSQIASSLITSQVPSSLTKANLAIGDGTTFFTGSAINAIPFTIPLPQFPDGVTATDQQVIYQRAWFNELGLSDRGTSPSTNISARVIRTSGRNYTATANNTTGDSFDIHVCWLIIAAR